MVELAYTAACKIVTPFFSGLGVKTGNTYSSPLLYDVAQLMQQPVTAGETCGTGCCVAVEGDDGTKTPTLLDLDDHIADNKDPCVVRTCTVRKKPCVKKAFFMINTSVVS